jgi:hypothetical protein
MIELQLTKRFAPHAVFTAIGLAVLSMFAPTVTAPKHVRLQ